MTEAVHHISDAADELDEYLDPRDEYVEPETMGEEAADRQLAVVRRLDRKLAANRALVDERIALLRQWQAEREEVLGGERARREALLEGWARAMHRDNPRVVTWKLPHGTVTLRDAQARVVLVGDEITVAEALEAVGFEKLVETQVVRKVPKDRVKQVAAAGEEIASFGTASPMPEPEDGYEYREALVRSADEATGEVYETSLPFVVLLVPTRKRFKATPR